MNRAYAYITIPIITVAIGFTIAIFVLIAIFSIDVSNIRAERAAKFAARCDKAGFTAPQCAMLYEINRQRANDDSEDAALIGHAVGTATGGGFR
jgi:hypothetical protein